MSNAAQAMRAAGISSRARKITPQTGTWRAGNGIEVPMPISIDILENDGMGRLLWQVDVLVDVDAHGELQLTHAQFQAESGLDLRKLQLHFRWQTPIDIVQNLIPRLMAQGSDFEAAELPLDDFPDAVRAGKRIYNDLTDEFLAQVVWHKRTMGKGYAKNLAEARGVPVRTVISWMEKAKKRGLLQKDKH